MVAVAIVGGLQAVVGLRGGLPKIVAAVVAGQTAVGQIAVGGQTAVGEQTVVGVQTAVGVYPVAGKTVGAAVGQTAVVAVDRLAVGEDHQKRQ